MTTRGAGTTDHSFSDPCETQVVDVRELDLRDSEGMRPASRRTAPPPLPASSVGAQLPSSSAPPVSPEPARASSSRQRSNGFFVGVILASLVLSLVAGFFIAARSGRGAPASSVTPTARVITIAPVEVK